MKAVFVLFVVACFFMAAGCENEAAHKSEESESAELKNIQYPKEWHLWKAKHKKTYESVKHELSKHLVWLSNKKYIEEHNKHADALGYGLAMNQFGDLVHITIMWKV